MRRVLRIALVFGVLSLAGCGVDEDHAPTETHTTMQIMQSVIAPATDTLWAADDPQSDDDWRVLEDAARDIIAVGSVVYGEGLSADERARAEEGAWRAYTAEMMDATQDALRAIDEKDIDALFSAGDRLFMPCEACHQAYYPQAVTQ